MPKHYTMKNIKYIIFEEEDIKRYLPEHLQSVVRQLHGMVMKGRQAEGKAIPRLAVKDLRDDDTTG